jgi:hypothetical protein
MYTIRPCSTDVIGFDGPHADIAIASIGATARIDDCRRARATVSDLVKRPKLYRTVS